MRKIFLSHSTGVQYFQKLVTELISWGQRMYTLKKKSWENFKEGKVQKQNVM